MVINSHRTDIATTDPADAPAGTGYAPSVFAVLFLGHRAAEHQHDTAIHIVEREPIVFFPALW